MLILRLLHILTGVFWAGTIFFMTFYLEPSARAAGPDAAKVMGGLQKRGLMTVLPIVALLTILSGVDLYRRLSVGFEPAWINSRISLTYGTGAVASIIALAIGFFVMRPATMTAGRLAASISTVSEEPERQRLQANIQQLRGRSRTALRAIAGLLALAVITMAVGRYM
jgi:uncharacterized membrane protein